MTFAKLGDAERIGLVGGCRQLSAGDFRARHSRSSASISMHWRIAKKSVSAKMESVSTKMEAEGFSSEISEAAYFRMPVLISEKLPVE
jgi:hypothetical protein